MIVRAFSYLLAAHVEAVVLIMAAWWIGEQLNENYPFFLNWWIVTFILAALAIFKSWYVILKTLMKQDKERLDKKRNEDAQSN